MYSQTKEQYFNSLRSRWSHGTLKTAALMTYVATAADDADADRQLREAGQGSVALMEQHGVLTPDLTVYEIGCGCGRVATELSEYLTGGQYVGVDLSPQYVDICNRRAPRGTFKVTNGYSFPLPDESADLVIEFSIFCHMPLQQVWKWLLDTRRVLKPTGQTYLQFHNFASQIQWDGFVKQADSWSFLDIGHPRATSEAIICQLFSRAGLMIERMCEVDIDETGEPNSWFVIAHKI